MSNAARVGTAVAAGYLLGRTKRLKLALTVGGLLVGRRIPTTPRGLLQEGQQLIDSNPELAKIEEEIRGKLLEAAKGAALATVRSTMDSFSDSLHDRTQSLRGLAEPEEGEESEEPEDVAEEGEEGEEEPEEPEDEAAEEEEPEEAPEDEEPEDEAEEPEEEQPPARKPRKKAPARTAAKKAPAKKTAAKKSAAKKSTGSSGDRGARKGASAKKTTSGNRR